MLSGWIQRCARLVEEQKSDPGIVRNDRPHEHPGPGQPLSELHNLHLHDTTHKASLCICPPLRFVVVVEAIFPAIRTWW